MKPIQLILPIIGVANPTGFLGRNGIPMATNVIIDNDAGVKGVLMGSIEICGVFFHVEAIEVKVRLVKPGRNVFTFISAVNEDYQRRIDSFCEVNDGERPQLVQVGRKKYYLDIQPFAQ